MFSSRLNGVTMQATSGGRLLSPSDKRWGIILQSDVAAGIFVSNDSIGSATVGGPSVYPLPGITGTDVRLNVRDHGNVVQQAWYYYNNNGAVHGVGVIEIMACDCESEAMLRDALGHRSGDEDWHKRYSLRK